jgi:hypothetical protein
MQTILTSTATTVQHTTLKGDLIKVEGIGPGGSGSAKFSNTRHIKQRSARTLRESMT